ncbi:MAG: hypothetical protein KGQ42_02845 [Alphaproteobacteria bacterium]|nr:hypothetical protein [Alphaproteobacteria bacterium]MDE2340610.1 hypothetical protein [Alphaproteobacteria bacterium]
MDVKRTGLPFVACMSLLAQPLYSAPVDKAYWASIAVTRAMMRAGPGRSFPALWEYRRQDLPVKVVQTYQDWRKVDDPDGASGWLQAHLLSPVRTAIVRGGEPRELHQTPDADAPVNWRVEAGVVGRISQCNVGWCRFDVHGRNGYIQIIELWGVE